MAHQFKAGAGSSSIMFPDDMFPTDGFCGVHDYPHTRILLTEGDIKFALVVMELVNIPEDVTESVRKMVADKTGTAYENVWVHGTHAISTPHAPRDPSVPIGGRGPDKPGKGPGPKPPAGNGPKMDPEGPRKRREFVDAVMASAEDALDIAVKSYGDAVLGVGTGLCDININRDYETDFGWWTGFDPNGYSNKTATVIRVENKDGIICLLVSYDIKPCALDNTEMDAQTRLVSSDVPGLACSILEEKYGAPVIFTMAAACDQVTREQALYEKVLPDGTVGKVDEGVSKGLEIVDRLGNEMADDISSIAEKIECHPLASSIKTGDTSIVWPSKTRVPSKPTKEIIYEKDGDRTADIDAHAVILGDDVCIVAVKPEVNSISGSELKSRSPYKNTIMISNVNGGMKYMPDKAAYDRVTYEAIGSLVMPGAAEAWIEAVGQMLDSLNE